MIKKKHCKNSSTKTNKWVRKPIWRSFYSVIRQRARVSSSRDFSLMDSMCCLLNPVQIRQMCDGGDLVLHLCAVWPVNCPHHSRSPPSSLANISSFDQQLCSLHTRHYIHSTWYLVNRNSKVPTHWAYFDIAQSSMVRKWRLTSGTLRVRTVKGIRVARYNQPLFVFVPVTGFSSDQQ